MNYVLDQHGYMGENYGKHPRDSSENYNKCKGIKRQFMYHLKTEALNIDNDFKCQRHSLARPF